MRNSQLARALLLSLAVILAASSTASAQAPHQGSREVAAGQRDGDGRSVQRRLNAASRLRETNGRFMSNEAARRLSHADPAHHSELTAQAHARMNRVRQEVGLPQLPVPVAHQEQAERSTPGEFITTRDVHTPGFPERVRAAIGNAIDAARGRAERVIGRVLGG